MKWNQLGNSLSNLQNVSVSQTDYNGITVSEVASNIHHCDVEEVVSDEFLRGADLYAH